MFFTQETACGVLRGLVGSEKCIEAAFHLSYGILSFLHPSKKQVVLFSVIQS